ALLGVPRDDWDQFRAWTDAVIGTADTKPDPDAFETAGRLFHCVRQLIALSRNGSRDDVLSVLAGAEADGHRLSDEDLLDFSFLLLASGIETTRSLLALGTLALIAHPDQRRLVAEDPGLLPGAIEEMLRWTSPVTHMARTATSDVEIRGQRIAAGDTVVLLYGS